MRTKLYSIGTTLKGTQLMVLEITNHKTGAAEDKPAYYYDGNIHAGELTGAEVALALDCGLQLVGFAGPGHGIRARALCQAHLEDSAVVIALTE